MKKKKILSKLISLSTPLFINKKKKMNNTNNNNGSFVPVVIYNNLDSEKLQILKDNKWRTGIYLWRTGIYLWTHVGSGKIYIGSAFDLSDRLKRYFSPSELKRVDNYICRALLDHTHSAFSLAILEYIDITNLSKKEARELILEREQFYLDVIFEEDEPNTYNLLKKVGSSLGYEHSEESFAKMSLAKAGVNHPMYGKTGESNPFFGKTHTPGTLAKMSEANKGNKNSSKKVFVYSIDPETKEMTLHKSFDSCIVAAKYLNCANYTIPKYIDKNKLYKKQWILSSSEK